MYGKDTARYNQLVAEATKQAQLKAQMEGMDAEEKSAGHAGRMTLADLSNTQSTDRASNYNKFGKDTMDAESEGKLEKIRKELDTDMLNALASTDDPQEAAAILSRAKVSGGLKSRSGRDMADLPPEAAMQLAKKLVVQTPKHQQAMELEGQKGANKAALEIYKQAGANTRAEKALVARQAVERMKRERPDKYSIVMKYAEDNNVSPFEALVFLQTSGVLQQGQNTVDQANAIMPPNKQMPNPTPVQAPSRGAPAPSASNQKPNVVKGNTFNGKTVVDVMRDKEGNPIKVKLSDGSVADFK